MNIGAATFYSGHHTVYQHAHFEFGLENVSRQFVWSFPARASFLQFRAAEPALRAPRPRARLYPSGRRTFRSRRARDIRTSDRACLGVLPRTLPGSRIGSDGQSSATFGTSAQCRILAASRKSSAQPEKRAIEVARYVLPVAAFTTMVHTLSGIVLHRLWRMQAACDTPAESRAVLGAMVARVREIDPQFFDRFDDAADGRFAGMAIASERSEGRIFRRGIRRAALRQDLQACRLFAARNSRRWRRPIARWSA